MERPVYTWMGFLAIAFAAVGMTGLFASYAAPLPLQRAMMRDVALQDALDAASRPDAAAEIEALAPRLGESADAIMPVDAGMPARILRERSAMHARFMTETQEGQEKLRWLVSMITLMGAVFGAAILAFAARK